MKNKIDWKKEREWEEEEEENRQISKWMDAWGKVHVWVFASQVSTCALISIFEEYITGNNEHFMIKNIFPQNIMFFLHTHITFVKHITIWFISFLWISSKVTKNCFNIAQEDVNLNQTKSTKHVYTYRHYTDTLHSINEWKHRLIASQI